MSSRVAAVVAYFPPTDLRLWVNPGSLYYERFPALRFDPDRADEVSPALHASMDDAPMLLIHGDKDELVPIKHSEQMLAACKDNNVECELVVIEGAAHEFSGSDANRAAEARLAWFEKHLKSQ